MRLLSFFRLSRSFHHEETWLQEFLLLPLATYRCPVTQLCFTVTQLCLIFALKISLAVCMETRPRTEQEASHGILSSAAQKGKAGKRKRKGRGRTATPTYRSLIEATKRTCVTQLFENSVGAKWPGGVATRRITRSFVYFERVTHLHLYAKC